MNTPYLKTYRLFCPMEISPSEYKEIYGFFSDTGINHPVMREILAYLIIKSKPWGLRRTAQQRSTTNTGGGIISNYLFGDRTNTVFRTIRE